MNMPDTIWVCVYYATGRCLHHLCFVCVICAVTAYYCCCPFSSSCVIIDMLFCLIFNYFAIAHLNVCIQVLTFFVSVLLSYFLGQFGSFIMFCLLLPSYYIVQGIVCLSLLCIHCLFLPHCCVVCYLSCWLHQSSAWCST